MMPVDEFLRRRILPKYTDDFKSYKHTRMYPHPLFTQDTIPDKDIELENSEMCPCCIEQNSLAHYEIKVKLSDKVIKILKLLKQGKTSLVRAAVKIKSPLIR